MSDKVADMMKSKSLESSSAKSVKPKSAKPAKPGDTKNKRGKKVASVSLAGSETQKSVQESNIRLEISKSLYHLTVCVEC